MTTTRAHFFLLLCICVVFLPQAARAGKINEAGAQRLQAIFDHLIEEQKILKNLKGQGGLTYEGEVVVEQAGTYYAVTLPHISIQHVDSSRLEIGMVAINAAPHDKDGQWKMSVATPTPIILMDADQQQKMRLDIKAQQTVGIWDENLDYFAKLDADYQDIALSMNYEEYVLSIPHLKIRYDLDQDEQGRWSGPSHVTAKDINLNFPAIGLQAKTDELKVEFHIDQYDPAIMKNYREQVIALAESSADAPGKSPSGGHIMGMHSMIFDTLARAGNGFTSQYSASGIHFTGPEDSAIELKIDKSHLGFDMTDLLTNDVGMALRLGYNGLTSSSTQPEFKDIQPSDVHIDLRLQKLPFQEVSALIKDTIQGSMAQPGMIQLAGLTLMMKIPALLSQSETIMAIENNYIGNDEYRVELNGTVKADIKALNGITAQARAVFHGLDKLLAKTQVLAADPNHEHAERFRNLNATLETIKNIAKAETAPGSTFVHVLDIIMDEKGQTLINGQDAKAILSPNETSPEQPPNPEESQEE